MHSHLWMLLALGCATTRPALPNDDTPPTSTPPSSASAPAPAPARPPAPPTIGRAAIPGSTLVVMSRPLVGTVLVDDPVGLALHWEHQDGPLPMGNGTEPELALADTLSSLRFEITRPDGKSASYQANWRDTLPKRYPHHLYYQPTLFLTLSAAGLLDASGFDGAWRGSAPDFSAPGTYQLRIQGELRFLSGAPLAFASEPISVEVVSSGVAPLATLLRAAEAERTKATSGASWAGRGQSTESGFLPGVVIEDERGDRIVRAAELPIRFGYTLHSTTLAADGTVRSHEASQISTCVAEGTLVETPSGPVPVESLAPGAQVWSFEVETGQQVPSTITAIHESRAETLIELGELRVTPEHPVYRDGTWIAAGDLLPGDPLLQVGGGWVPAAPALHTGAAVRVFDLDVDGPDNFYAGGLLIHNKDRSYLSWLDDPWYFMWQPQKR